MAQNLIDKIRRKYRIKPSEELLNFWNKVEQNKFQENYIPFRHFKIKLLTLEQVAEFDHKDIRFWFKKKGQRFLVRYYIPIADYYTFGNAVVIAAYDHSKNFIGIFLANLDNDPFFITEDLFSLLKNEKPKLSLDEFLDEQVSSDVRFKFDFDESYFDENENHHPELFDKDLIKVLEFIKLVYNSLYAELPIEIKTLKNSFKLSFKAKEKHKNQVVKQEIEIPRLTNFISLDIIIPILNRINYEWWNGGSSLMSEYGFYRTHSGIAMLHIHQVCEYIRAGAIPHLNNVHFPPIVYSKHPSGFESIVSYEVKFFEKQEDYLKWYKQYEIDSSILSVRNLEEKDIPKIVDYFLDSKNHLVDGIEYSKVPYEEEIIETLETSMSDANDKKQRYYLILENGGKNYGHCHIERFENRDEAYFYFYDWEGLLRNEKRIDGLINLAIQNILSTYPLKTIYSEPTRDDKYRNGVFERLGFEKIGEHQEIRDAISRNDTFVKWKLNKIDFDFNP